MHTPDFSLAHDIGRHAAHEALRAMHDAIDRLPDSATKVVAAAMAAGVLKARIQIMVDGLDKRDGSGNFAEIVNKIAEEIIAVDGPKIRAKADSVAKGG